METEKQASREEQGERDRSQQWGQWWGLATSPPSPEA